MQRIVVFFTLERGPLYLSTLDLHQESVLSIEAAMIFTVAQTGQTKHLLIFYDNWTGSLSCLEGEGEWRGIQLQHATSPLDVTKFYTLNL